MSKRRAESTARRKARKEKSRQSLHNMPTRQEQRRQKEEAAERRLREKHQRCPYHGVALDPKDGEVIYYAEGADKALILRKRMNSGWPLWIIECEVCNESWMQYHVKAHP